MTTPATTSPVLIAHLNRAVLGLLDETFENVHGIFLDKNTSLFETLATISAAEASIPVSATCASIAAQVEHIRFYIDTMHSYARGENPGKVDWDQIWNTVEVVTQPEWEASVARLRDSYVEFRTLIGSQTTWETEGAVEGAFAMITHTAYHLGEIRQALCTVRGRAN